MPANVMKNHFGKAMKRYHILLWLVAIVFALVGCALQKSALADSNALDSAIASFPDTTVGRYRSDIAVKSVNTLITAGKDASYPAIEKRAALIRFSVTNHQINVAETINERLCHLIRLLFVSTNNSSPLRPPRLGLLSFLPVLTMDETNWPCLPFFITNGIPLSLHFGYNTGGFPERADAYFKYCKANGQFRTALLTIPTYTSESNAIKGMLDSPNWKSLKWTDHEYGFSYKLDPKYVEERLWQQLTNLDVVANPNTSTNGHR